ncbi:AAA family ATPase [Microbacterium sp. PAMC21962]|uniref:AAA family ATPase n=1 Tax=Microbacterium sp. PAMC21962 TaxID=2861280 RepID=UPI001C6307A4|nr:AAA family ATPase [Microbacterium sp. PAMC21962]QYF98480.1 AAA family ATPase [Microbacterium sp. PAMC21962]
MSEYDDAYASGPAPMSPSQLAERHVLGAIMSDPSVLRAVQAEVVPGDFDDLRLAAIYRGIIGMVAAQEPIDYLAVFDHLTDWDVRGLDLRDLDEWCREVPTRTNVAYHARRIRERSVARKLRQIGESLVQAEDPGVALASAMTRLTEIRDRDVATDAPARTLRDVLAVPEEEDVYDWVVPNVLERNDRLVLTGGEGAGKSTLLRQIAVMPAAGLHPFTQSRIDPIRVLVVDAENSERQWRRAVRRMASLAAINGSRDPQDHVALEFLSKSDITDPATLGGIHRRMDHAAPDLVLIGPLYRLAPGSIKDDDDAAPVLNALDSIRERGVAMLIEAHAGHETSRQGVRNLRPRGSSALLGWPEFGMGLAEDNERVGGVRRYSLVRWRGDRDERAFPHKFVRGQSWPWEVSAW